MRPRLHLRRSPRDLLEPLELGFLGTDLPLDRGNLALGINQSYPHLFIERVAAARVA